MSKSPSALELFLPPVQQWFQSALGPPTAAQQQGWPAIAAGENTLILAPTGSGKTLAAFLACLDFLWRQPQLPPGVQVLYVSPLKALNNDIHRNLQVPLHGVMEAAAAADFPLPTLAAAVRTGDTPSAERQRLIRKPPHVLITTPESLNLLLTSKARETLRTIKFCIVDEIHSVCTNKRGVFLALLLERLAALCPDGFVRIGLSATQRPLSEVSRYLGGHEVVDEKLPPRPVTIIDAGLRKELDLKIISPVQQFGALPEKTIWPSIYRLTHELISRHNSTIVFANSRRVVERITANINGMDQELTEDADNADDLVRAHHGSVSLEVRRATEEALKNGDLASVVATASLELGIDMGAVDLVCQIESPGNVSRGLQRVGRAGHLVGNTSKGRLIPKTLGDLLEQAVLAREMAAGHVEECRTPVNCLDVLAQQIVAMTAVDSWIVTELYALVRQAYPYRDLTPHAFETVVEMVSGRYRFRFDDDGNAISTPTMTALQPRISWDRVHNRLLALPGSQQLALLHGGTIPDTGQYATYTTTGVRIGELDEEFIYERRVGDTFLLGTHSWRVEEIEADRVIVAPAEGAVAMIPFWRGENVGRSYELGCAVGEFLRAFQERLTADDCQEWLEDNYFLDTAAARNLRGHVRRQWEKTGCLPTDRTIFVEACRDQLGDWQILLLSPFGGRLHLGLRLAIENCLLQRLGYRPQSLHHNDGILIRLTDSDEPILDLLAGINAENVQDLIVTELADSPLFALRFRHNAARALLMPTGGAGKRAPLWLQRLRGKDLLQVARRHADFPIVVETFRECLQDYLDVPRLQQLLADIAAGSVEIVTARRDSPSPFASSILFDFEAAFMYQYDEREGGGADGALDQNLLDQLLATTNQEHLLDQRAIARVDKRLRGAGHPPRTAPETAEWLRRLGDVVEADIEEQTLEFLRQLESDGTTLRIVLPATEIPRWILAEEKQLYEQAFGMATVPPDEQKQSAETILQRFLNTHALVGLAEVLEVYPFDSDWITATLEKWSQQGRAISIPASATAEPLQWSAPENLEQIQRSSLSLLRREVMTVPCHQFMDFLTRWQKIHPDERFTDAEDINGNNVAAILDILEGEFLPADLWEQFVLPARLPGYQKRMLDDLLASGEWLWYCRGDETGKLDVSFLRRESLAERLPPPFNEVVLSSEAESVLRSLQQRGALFVVDISRHAGQNPAAVRNALAELLRHGLVTNDRFDVIRQRVSTPSSTVPATAVRQRGIRRAPAPDGRWSLLPWMQPHVEAQAMAGAKALLHRYGVAARELAQMDERLPAWRVLYEVLSRMELAGEVRRGYFVEGLSGAQFALPEAADMLRQSGSPAQNAPAVLLHSLDPANLFGAGAPFSIALNDNENHTFSRRAGNWLVISNGRAVLLIEQHGKRLTTVAGATTDQITAAVALLPDVLRLDRTLRGRHKLSVRRWNQDSVIGSEGQGLLEAVGFVRDYQDLTLYAAWDGARGR